MQLNDRQVYAFFRLELVTGLLDKPAVVAWADARMLSMPVPSEAMMELSLCGRLPYSQIIRMLNTFQEGEPLDQPLKLLFAHAGLRLEQNPVQACRILQGLLLVNAEYILPLDVRHALVDLQNALELCQQAALDLQALYDRIASFLAPYHHYVDDLKQVIEDEI